MDVDLRGGQTNALGVVHGLSHVFDDLSNAIVDLGDRLGNGSKPSVWVVENF
jgi:hypothetical protein